MFILTQLYSDVEIHFNRCALTVDGVLSLFSLQGVLTVTAGSKQNGAFAFQRGGG